MYGREHPMLTELQFYLASIITPKNMRPQDMAESGMSQQQFDTFHNCLYRYSHTKIVGILENKVLGVLYQHFYNGPIEEILRAKSSACKNYEVYSKALKEFYEIFRGVLDVSTIILN